MGEFDLQNLIDDLESRVHSLEPLEHNEFQAGGKYLFNRLYDYDPFFRHVMGRYIALIVTVARLRPDCLGMIDDDLQRYGDSVFAAIGADHMLKKEE